MTTTIGGMTKNRLKQGMREGKKQIGFWLTADSIAVTEYAANVGFDWIMLDTEHTSLDLGRVEQHVLAAKGGNAELVVRVPSVDPAHVKRLLDMGVRSLMFPYVETVEQAQLAVSSTLYAPRGIRGYSGAHRRNGYGDSAADYLASYADEQVVIVQVESQKGVAAIPAMAKIEGLDCIFVGPNDLSFSLGVNGDMSQQVVKDKVREALKLIKDGGKVPGILNFSKSETEELFRAGYEFIAVHGDSSVLGAGAKDFANSYNDRQSW